mmetsp:Transcript_62198/g.110875  ORF Transcript_62198/g.110875 Transcript_62198/m.110875 type:complete len:210 (+) Transcript_62198:917-1546(+)
MLCCPQRQAWNPHTGLQCGRGEVMGLGLRKGVPALSTDCLCNCTSIIHLYCPCCSQYPHRRTFVGPTTQPYATLLAKVGVQVCPTSATFPLAGRRTRGHFGLLSYLRTGLQTCTGDSQRQQWCVRTDWAEFPTLQNSGAARCWSEWCISPDRLISSCALYLLQIHKCSRPRTWLSGSRTQRVRCLQGPAAPTMYADEGPSGKSGRPSRG